MSVRIIEGSDGYKVIYDSVTMTAFGPVFYEKDDVENFLDWLSPIDARTLSQTELADKRIKWLDFMDEEVSDCCGANPRGNGDSDSSDIGICPDCGDHCEYIERRDLDF